MTTKSDLMPFIKRGVLREIFSHATLGHFDVTTLQQHIAALATHGAQPYACLFDAVRAEDGSPDPMKFLADQREIDEGRVAELTPEDLNDPVIFVLCPPSVSGSGETHLLVDGIHRLTALYRAGSPGFLLWLVPYAEAKALTSPSAVRRAINIPWGRKEVKDGQLKERE